MLHSLAILNAADFATWKSSYHSAESVAARKAAGEKSYMLLRTIDNPNKFVLLNEWEDIGRAQQFMQSEELRKMQADSGIVGQPEILVFAEVEKGTV